MFDFLKKKEVLFRQDVMLDPSDDDVLMQGCQVMTLKEDGTAYAEKKKAGMVYAPAWEYVTGFCMPKTMKRKSFNLFEIEVTGTADRSLVFPDPHDKPYVFRCGYADKYPHLLPATEYLCDVKDGEIFVGGQKIGETTKSKKIEQMVKSGFQATAQIMPTPHSCGIFVIVRKV